MRNLSKVLIIFLFTLFFYSCNKERKKKEEGIKIELEFKNSTSIFDYFAEIEIIPLESNEECLLNDSPEKILPVNHKYYILDQKQKSIFIFNENGTFIKKIKKEGQGPGEYSTLDDFTLNRFTGNIELMSSFSTINIYDSLGDNFIKKINIEGEILHAMENVSEDVYVFFNSFREKNKMFFYSRKEKKILNEVYSLPDFIFTNTVFHHNHTPFYLYNDSIHFIQNYNGNIYDINVSDYSLKLRYKWDMGESNFDISVLPDNETMEYYWNYYMKANLKHPMVFNYNVENNKYFIATFVYKNKNNLFIYEKKKQEYVIISNFIEDFLLLPMYMDEEYIYSWHNPENLNLFINPDILDERNKEIYNSIQETDNLVILKFKFR